MENTSAVPGDLADSQGVSTALLVVVTTLLFASWLSFSTLTRFRRRLPPGPRGWPILGSLPYLGALPHKALRKLSKKYGPIMFMHLGSMPTVVISNADMAEQVLKTNDHNMASRPELTVPNYITFNSQDMTYAPYGDHWRNVRKICTLRLFTAARINHYRDIRQREVREMLQAIHNECQLTKPVVAHHFVADMSSNIMTQMMWGKRHSGIRGGKQLAHDRTFTFGELSREVALLLGAVNIGDYIPMLKSPAMKIQGLDKRMKAVRQHFESFIDHIIEEHQHSRPPIGNSDQVEDFVHLLLRHTQDAEPEFEETLSNDAMKAVLLDMLTAGTETTTTTLEWALAELVRHPNVMAKAQDELKSAVGSDRLVMDADIPNLKYLQAVIKETFRMHPPIPLGAPHKSMHDCLIGGFHIPAQTVVVVNIFAAHRDPAVWERSEEFDPERFLNSLIDFKGQNFELIPFGAGRRMCPAVNLATASVSLSLANLLHAFTWSLPTDQMPEDMDMRDSFGLSAPKAIPLAVLAKPCLSHQVIYSGI